MTCTKCGGLVVAGDYEGEAKCVQCSQRFYQAEEDSMAGWTEARRAKFMATIAAKNGKFGRPRKDDPAHAARSKNAQEAVGGTNGHSPRVAMAGPTNVVPGANWAEWRGSILASLDQAIGQLEDQLTKTRAARAAVEGL